MVAGEQHVQAFPGAQRSRVLSRFIRNWQRPAVVVVVGGGMQVLGGVVSLFAVT